MPSVCWAAPPDVSTPGVETGACASHLLPTVQGLWEAWEPCGKSTSFALSAPPHGGHGTMGKAAEGALGSRPFASSTESAHFPQVSGERTGRGPHEQHPHTQTHQQPTLVGVQSFYRERGLLLKQKT